jgi:glycosyltransferase involved in cell wall biosynthesis
MRKSRHLTNRKANPWTPKNRNQQTPPTTTIIVPTASRSPTLRSVLATHQHQTEPHETIIIDTSTDHQTYPDFIADFKHNKSPRYCYLPPKPNAAICSVITEAIDMAIAIATTEWVLLTHDDVWLKRNDFITQLIKTALFHSKSVVGYEMSPRDHVTQEWRGMVSHTATLLHRPTMVSIGARWNLTEATDRTDPAERRPGWPDTETNFGRLLKDRSILPLFIASETNEPHYEDDNIVHRRSLTSHRTHPALANAGDEAWITEQIARFSK